MKNLKASIFDERLVHLRSTDIYSFFKSKAKICEFLDLASHDKFKATVICQFRQFTFAVRIRCVVLMSFYNYLYFAHNMIIF